MRVLLRGSLAEPIGGAGVGHADAYTPLAMPRHSKVPTRSEAVDHVGTRSRRRDDALALAAPPAARPVRIEFSACGGTCPRHVADVSWSVPRVRAAVGTTDVALFLAARALEAELEARAARRAAEHAHHLVQARVAHLVKAQRPRQGSERAPDAESPTPSRVAHRLAVDAHKPVARAHLLQGSEEGQGPSDAHEAVALAHPAARRRRSLVEQLLHRERRA